MGEVRTIEVDAETAEALEHHAAEKGISVTELLTDIAKQPSLDESEAEQIADLILSLSKDGSLRRFAPRDEAS